MRFSVVKCDFAEGLPVGDDTYYECLRCGAIIPTHTSQSGECLCGNFQIDTGYARIDVEDLTQVRLLRKSDWSAIFHLWSNKP